MNGGGSCRGSPTTHAKPHLLSDLTTERARERESEIILGKAKKVSMLFDIYDVGADV